MSEDFDLLRKGLWPLSLAYGLAVSTRNMLFDSGLRAVHGVDVPVVSVGNLAAGGTGKTPLVAWLIGQARERRLRAGVLARGYGRGPGEELNDEGRLLERRFPTLCQVQDPDRVRGARRLVDDMKVDVVILDDGFQHRRLQRDRDLVCLDFVRPFAGGLLPVGYLREPPKSMRRAQALVLTRAGGFNTADIDERKASLRPYVGPDMPIFVTDHSPARLVSRPDGAESDLEWLRGRKVYLLSGIARPQSFAKLVANLGGEIVGHRIRRDHHLHTAAELAEVERIAAQHGAVVLTTEKDEAKLADMQVQRYVLEIEIVFVGEQPQPEWLFSRATTEAAG